jgi:hypothetical protein
MESCFIEYQGKSVQLNTNWEKTEEAIDSLISEKLVALSAKIWAIKKLGIKITEPDK